MNKKSNLILSGRRKSLFSLLSAMTMALLLSFAFCLGCTGNKNNTGSDAPQVDPVPDPSPDPEDPPAEADVKIYSDGHFTAEIPETESEMKLATLAARVNGNGFEAADYAGKTVQLQEDIDLSGYADWEPIGGKDYVFAGTFDGNGKNITGLSITSHGTETIEDSVAGSGTPAYLSYKGLFGNISGTIRDFSISGTMGTSETRVHGYYYGGAAAYSTGKVYGVTSDVDIFAGDSAYVSRSLSPIVGMNYGGEIKRCKNTGEVDAPYLCYQAGGICGTMDNGGTVAFCANKADLTANSFSAGAFGVGGIAGKIEDNASVLAWCYNTGYIENTSGKTGAGGLCGTGNGNIKFCYTSGNTWGENRAGVLIGHFASAVPDEVPAGYLASVAEYLFFPETATVHNNGQTITSTTNTEPKNGTFFLDSTGYKGYAIGVPNSTYYVVRNSFFKSEEYMKSADTAADSLLSNLGIYFEADTENVNNGYPVLYWEKEGTVLPENITALQIITPPAKTAYGETQFFNPEGAALAATFDNGRVYAVALSDCTYSPSEALQASDTSVTFSYTYNGVTKTAVQPVTVAVKTLESIAITSQPTSKVCAADETFNSEGLVVTATFVGGDTETVESSSLQFTENRSLNTVTASYKFKDVTATADINITFLASNAPTRIYGGGPFGISNGDQLLWFANKVNVGSVTSEAKLLNDIDASAFTDFPGIGIYTTNSTTRVLYTGTFDGNGKTIKLAISRPDNTYAGLFSCVGGNAVIKDFTITSDSSVTGKSYTAAVAAYIGATAEEPVTIQNVVNNGAVSTADLTSGYAAGFIANCYSGLVNISNCTNNGAVNAGKLNAAGFVATQATTTSACLVMTDCFNNGAVSAPSGPCAGLVANYTSGSITRCGNNGPITVTGYSSSTEIQGSSCAGLVASTSSIVNTITIESCYNKAPILSNKVGNSSSLGAGLAGLVGVFSGGSTAVKKITMTNCYNTGSVTGNADGISITMGGIIGQAKGGKTGVSESRIENCYTSGVIYGSAGVPAATGLERTGAFMGIYFNTAYLDVVNSFWLDSVYSTFRGTKRQLKEYGTLSDVSKTDAQMQTLESDLGSAFKSGSGINASGYPALVWE